MTSWIHWYQCCRSNTVHCPSWEQLKLECNIFYFPFSPNTEANGHMESWIPVMKLKSCPSWEQHKHEILLLTSIMWRMFALLVFFFLLFLFYLNLQQFHHSSCHFVTIREGGGVEWWGVSHNSGVCVSVLHWDCTVPVRNYETSRWHFKVTSPCHRL